LFTELNTECESLIITRLDHASRYSIDESWGRAEALRVGGLAGSESGSFSDTSDDAVYTRFVPTVSAYIVYYGRIGTHQTGTSDWAKTAGRKAATAARRVNERILRSSRSVIGSECEEKSEDAKKRVK